MDTHLFQFLNLKESNIFIPDGLSNDPHGEAIKYEEAIDAKGGIDLQYITLGTNGHMAYNEPGTKLDTLTHVVKLDDETRKVLVKQNKFPTYNETPDSAITVGVQTIAKMKEVMMVVVGAHKADIAKEMVEGPVTEKVPSSALQNHKNCIFVFDKAGASKLDLSKFDVKEF
jgi:glucosamine-6-phosphate deaminase